jgi:hypothetical protein
MIGVIFGCQEDLGTVEPRPNITIRSVRARAGETVENLGDLFGSFFTRGRCGFSSRKGEGVGHYVGRG